MIDGDGKPVNDALVEIWQANAHGQYAHPEDARRPAGRAGFSGFGRVYRPTRRAASASHHQAGPRAGPDGSLQAPHLNVTIFMRGLLKQLITRIYFPGDANDADAGAATRARRAPRTLIARRDAKRACSHGTSCCRATTKRSSSTTDAGWRLVPAPLFDPARPRQGVLPRRAHRAHARIRGRARARGGTRGRHSRRRRPTRSRTLCRADAFDIDALSPQRAAPAISRSRWWRRSPRGLPSRPGRARLRALGRDQPGHASTPRWCCSCATALALYRRGPRAPRRRAGNAGATPIASRRWRAARWLQQALAGRRSASSSRPASPRCDRHRARLRALRRRGSWCCSSAARPARSPRSARKGSRSTDAHRRGARPRRCRLRRGTRSATASSKCAATLGVLSRTLGKLARDICAARADRSRRGVRAGGAGPRRLVDDAAQAQSGRLRRSRSRPRRACRDWSPRMLAAAVQEHERGARRLARRMGHAARARASSPAGALAAMAAVVEGLSRRRAHARQPRPDAGPDPRRGRPDGAGAARSAATSRTRWSPRSAGARRAKAAALRDVLDADAARHAVARRRCARARLFDPVHYLGSSNAFRRPRAARALNRKPRCRRLQAWRRRARLPTSTARDAPLLVLSNSLGADLAMWEPQMPALRAAFSHGALRHARPRRVDAPPGPYSIEQLGRDVLALLDHLETSRARVLRHFDGRHDRHVARRARAASASTGWCSPTRRRASAPPTLWNTRIAHGAKRAAWRPSSDAVLARWFTPAFAAREPCDARAHEDDDGAPTRPQATSPAARRCATWTSATTSHAIAAPTLVDRRHARRRDAAGRRPLSRRAHRRRALVELDAAHLSNIERPTRSRRALRRSSPE